MARVPGILGDFTKKVYDVLYYNPLIAKVRKLWAKFTHEVIIFKSFPREDDFIDRLRSKIDYTKKSTT